MESRDERATMLTRRAALKGAAAAAVGAAGAGTAHLVDGEAAGAVAKPPFDIRDLVHGSDLDSDSIQRLYDEINLLVVLIGDIELRSLFRTRMSKLVPEVKPRVTQAARYGLISDPSKVRALGERLRREAAQLTVADFYIRSRDDVPRDVLRILIGLRRQGIRIPLPYARDRDSATRRLVVKQLLRAAPKLTFKQLQTMTHSDVSQAVQDAISLAKTKGLLSWQSNDRCCVVNGYAPFDLCLPNPGKFCAFAAHTVEKRKDGTIIGLCTIASDPCPASQRRLS